MWLSIGTMDNQLEKIAKNILWPVVCKFWYSFNKLNQLLVHFYFCINNITHYSKSIMVQIPFRSLVFCPTCTDRICLCVFLRRDWTICAIMDKRFVPLSKITSFFLFKITCVKIQLKKKLRALHFTGLWMLVIKIQYFLLPKD